MDLNARQSLGLFAHLPTVATLNIPFFSFLLVFNWPVEDTLLNLACCGAAWAQTLTWVTSPQEGLAAGELGTWGAGVGVQKESQLF